MDEKCKDKGLKLTDYVSIEVKFVLTFLMNIYNIKSLFPGIHIFISSKINIFPNFFCNLLQ